MNDTSPRSEPTQNSSKSDHSEDFARLEQEVQKHMFQSNLPRRFFIFEGIDGSGKTGLIDFLRRRLTGLTKRRVEVIRQPGYTEVGEKVRDIIKYSRGLDKVTEILLLEATRVEMAKKINQILKEDPDAIFLFDRHTDSTWVHQIESDKDGLFYMELLAAIRQRGVETPPGFEVEPDWSGEDSQTISFFLDVSPEESWKRCQIRSLKDGSPQDKFDLAPIELRRAWRQKYVDQILLHPSDYIVVDATKYAKVVCKEVLAACLVLLKLDDLSKSLEKVDTNTPLDIPLDK